MILGTAKAVPSVTFVIRDCNESLMLIETKDITDKCMSLFSVIYGEFLVYVQRVTP